MNYEDSNISKFRTADMSLLKKEPAGHHPIGITYDNSTGRVWVANYSGTIDIWNEDAPGAASAMTTVPNGGRTGG